MKRLELKLDTPEDTVTLGKALGERLQEGDLISLAGDLGAGKTTMAQGIAQGLGVKEPVTSPTFTLVNEYLGRVPLYHWDMYRLSEPEEVWEVGWEEYQSQSGVLLVEWAERMGDLFPSNHLEVNLKRGEGPGGEDIRIAVLVARGERYEALLKELKHDACLGH